MFTTQKYLLVTFLSLALIGCNANDPTSPKNKGSASIVGQVLDKASGSSISAAYVKIIQDDNSYGTTTDGSGHFSFKDIISGTYELISEVNQGGITLTDTAGEFSTDSTDWGAILTEVFVSISGTITIEGEEDHSFVSVLLLGTGSSALTDNNGRFRFDFILPGQYDIFASIDDDHLDYRENNILLAAGESFIADTTLLLRFAPLALVEVDPLFPSARTRGYGGFAHFGEDLYYATNQGLRKYNLVDGSDTLVYSHQFLGQPMVASDYDEGIWFCMDEPSSWMYRRYSVQNAAISDSLSGHGAFSAYNFSTAWDPTRNLLLGIEPWTSIISYDPATGEIVSTEFPFSYDESKYQNVKLLNIFIDPSGKLYLTASYETSTETQTHLIVCNNTLDFTISRIYRMDPEFHYLPKLFWFEGRILAESNTYGSNTLLEFLF